MDPDALARPEGLADSQTHHDFSHGKRGRIAAPRPAPQGIPVRIDQDLVDYFLKEADQAGGAVDHETLINDALRRIVREEIAWP